MVRKLQNNLRQRFIRIRRKMAGMSISVQITVFYLLILVCSIAISNLFYERIYSANALNKVSKIADQMIGSVHVNLSQLLGEVNKYSKTMMFDDDLQKLLKSENIYSDLRTQRRVGYTISKLIQDVPAITSVYLFDKNGNAYSVGNEEKTYTTTGFQKASWYQAVYQFKGAYQLRLNCDDAFAQGKMNIVSMIRLVRDINTAQPLGVLVVNIPESAFAGALNAMTEDYSSEMLLLDSSGQSIVRQDSGMMKDLQADDAFLQDPSQTSVILRSDRKYLYTRMTDSNNAWTLISRVPVGDLSAEALPALLIGFVIILINSLILMSGLVFTSRLLTKPIKMLLRSMKRVEKGELRRVELKSGNYEISELKDGYNSMISQVDQLIQRVMDEQQKKRKAELNILQEQIKPHFLYNTLDTVTALSLMGRTQDVTDILDALGAYYRTSLSKGREVITVAEEIGIAANYLKIQNIRYAELFTVIYDTDAQCSQCPVIKLIVQPVVENALYHGLRKKGEPGFIRISTRLDGDMVELAVEDNGAGMTPEVLNRILADGSTENREGFGLSGARDRLRLYFGDAGTLQIWSEEGSGTRVTMRFPADGPREAGKWNS